MALCDNCGNQEAYVLRITFSKDGRYSGCDKCQGFRATAVPDVYLGSSGGLQTDPNLCDPKTRKEIPFSTKGEKAAIMKQLKVRQSLSAERVHGYRREEFKKKIYFI